MSKTNIFKSLHLDKIVDNGYGRYPGECVSLVQRWLAYNGFPHEGHGNGEGYRDALVKRGWGEHVSIDDIKPGDVIAGARGTYGHVAICLGNGEILDAAGPSAGGSGITRISSLNGFIDRYNDVKVTRLKGFDNGEVVESVDKESIVGTKFTFKKGTVIYNDNPTPTAYPKQPTRDHEALIVQETGEWYKIRIAVLKPTDVWIYKKDLNGPTVATKPPVNKPVIKPTPKPQTKTVKLSGKTRLFVASGGTATFPQVPRKTHDHYTTLKARTVDVVEENALRVRVRIPGFNPELIWINKSELK